MSGNKEDEIISTPQTTAVEDEGPIVGETPVKVTDAEEGVPVPPPPTSTTASPKKKLKARAVLNTGPNFPERLVIHPVENAGAEFLDDDELEDALKKGAKQISPGARKLYVDNERAARDNFKRIHDYKLFNKLTKETPLHKAVEKNDCAEVERLLDDERNPADIDSTDPWTGKTPIIISACFGHTEMAELLLEKGCNIHAEDKLGNTALHYCGEEGPQQHGHKKIKALLLEKIDEEAGIVKESNGSRGPKVKRTGDDTQLTFATISSQ